MSDSLAVFGNDFYALEFLHTVRECSATGCLERKIAANGRSTIVATLDQMPGAR